MVCLLVSSDVYELPEIEKISQQESARKKKTSDIYAKKAEIESYLYDNEVYR